MAGDAFGILVGTARVQIVGDARGFIRDLVPQIKSELAGLDTRIPLKFSVDAPSVTAARKALGPLAGQSIPLRFKVDAASAARAQAALGPLAGKTVPIRYDVNTSGLAAATAAQKTLTASTKQTAAAAAGMTPVLIGAGVALGGVVTTAVAAGAGIAAFGLFAVPPILKVTKAIRGPGGLAASWATLTPLQQNLALGVQALGQRFTVLSNAMAPTTLHTFASALGLANSLLGPTARLATSAGAGIASFLNQFSAQSGIQQFVGYLSHLAGPSIALLGTDITNIAHAVFALLQSAGGAGLIELKALTLAITGVTTSITWLAQHAPGLTGAALAIGGTAVALSKLGAAAPALKLLGLSNLAGEMAAFGAATKGATLAEKGMLATTTLLDSVSPAGWAILAAAAVGALAFAFSRAKDVGAAYVTQLAAQDKATGFNISGYQKLAGQLGTTAAATMHVNDAIRQGSIVLTGGRAAWVTATTAQSNFVAAGQQASAQARNLAANLGTLQQRYGITRTQAEQMAAAAGVSAAKLAASGTAGQQALGKITAYGDANVRAQRPVIGLAAAVSQLTAAMNSNVIAVLTLQGDNIAWRQAQQAALTQLHSNSAGLRGNSANVYANQAAVLASTNAVVSFADHQLTLHGNLRLASQEIQSQIGWLQKHGEKTKFARDEIAALLTEEAKIRSQIGTNIIVHGSGQWTVAQVQSLSQPGGKLAGPLATGGRIPGYGGGDKWPALLEGGEAVVPKHLVAPIAPFLRAHKVPGFATGGVVGNYAGSVPGLSKWLASENSATIRAIESSVASATFAGMKAAVSAATAAAATGSMGASATGPLQTYARALLAGHGWASQWPAFADIVARESGWNVYATNPTSGAYGIPQALPGSKMAVAGADWRTSGYTQLRWMIDDYIGQRWGSPNAADANEIANHWYDGGGWLPKGLSLAMNRSGSEELVLNAGQLRQLGSGGGTEYHAHFDGSMGVLESKIRAAFTAMSINDGRRGRIGRNH